MKEIKFETSKGKFILLDVDYSTMVFVRVLDIATAYLECKELFDYKESFKLSEITEEEASEFVEYRNGFYKDFTSNTNTIQDWVLKSAIESLHSLLKSKGIYLFRNPNDTPYFTNRSTEEKTFYNPYIFKL